MAGRYSVGLEAMAQGQVNLLTQDIRVLACEATYVASLTADGFYAGAGTDILDGWLADNLGNLVDYNNAYYADAGVIDKAIVNEDSFAKGVNNPLTKCVGVSASALSAKTVTDGYLNGSDPLFSGLPGSKTITQLVVTAFTSYTVGVDTGSGSSGGFTVYRHMPLCLITHDTTDTAISFDTGTGLDLVVRWENVAPFIYWV